MAKEYFIEDILTRIKRPIELENNKEYELVTIRSKHRGVVPRGAKKGFDIKSKMYEVKSGDFILSGIDARHGAFGIIPPELDGAIVTNDFWYFEIDNKVISKELFLELTATSWFDEICKNGSDGTTNRVRLQKKKFFNQKILLPEFDKQKNLLSKFRQIKKKNTLLSGELEKQKSLISDLKQSILQEAIEGKLTQTWRTENPNVEPASKLLERIKAEKAQLIKKKKIKKEKPLPKITKAEIPFALPYGWVWCRLREISHLITKGSSPKWQGIRYLDEEGLLFITSENVGTNEILLKKKKFVEKRFNEVEPRSILIKGDILTNIVGGSIGRTAIYDRDETANINQAVCLIRIPNSNINKQYLVNYLNSNVGIRYMLAKQFSPGRANLSLTNISNMLVPFPPIEEQKIIEQEFDLILDKTNILEQEIENSETHAQMLMQAVLKEAFETA